ncbi:hypothetical protein EST38_g64 [Candolleomyces aberdarensis]|uniref:DUF6741 domain-containing protein n=1 Tax=Candolleomyces aberdarensis TaxID=2316362 RepID=A0A4Q2E1P9_9AGAR|nr:hypothetical protein EST38_g64 [Candolleomyces aberdarensis]
MHAASDPYPHGGSYSMYGAPSNALVPVERSQGLTIMKEYEDYDPRLDAYDYDMGGGGYPVAPMTPVLPRSRRNSAVSLMSLPGADGFRRGTGHRIKFKRKGTLMGGIGLDEAQSRVRLSNNDSYSFHDLHSDHHRRILLKVKWAGYNSLTYEIPLDGWDRRVNLETLARRVSRACVHYLQANVIPILWDRVVLHHLEEVTYGVWQPMLSTR